MTITRRSLLGSILAAATPPGFVRAGVLMPVAPLIVQPVSGMELMMNYERSLRNLDVLSEYLDRQFYDGYEWRTPDMSAKIARVRPPVVNMIRRA